MKKTSFRSSYMKVERNIDIYIYTYTTLYDNIDYRPLKGFISHRAGALLRTCRRVVGLMGS